MLLKKNLSNFCKVTRNVLLFATTLNHFKQQILICELLIHSLAFLTNIFSSLLEYLLMSYDISVLLID